MALRHIQLFRNGSPAQHFGKKHADVVALLEGKIEGQNSPFNAENVDVRDGELILYRYQLENGGDIHTVIAGVSVTENDVKKFEIVANYDMLTEKVNEINSAIENLDATVRGASDGTVSTDGQVTVSGNTGAYVAVEVVETNGKLTGITVKENIDDTIKARIQELDGAATIATISDDNVVTLKAGIVETDGIVSNNTDANIVLAKVAKTGAAVDVAIADADNLIGATTVEGALAEIAEDIDDMVLDATDVVSVSNAEFNASQISEADGIVTVEDSAVLFGFTSQPNNTNNKVVTQAELATAYTGDNGIKIDENLVVSTNFKFDLKTTSTTEGEVTTYNTVLSILDKNDNAVLAEVNVNELVKDSFLKDVKIDETTQNLVFTFVTDNGTEEGQDINERTIEIPISDLCDVYTTDDVYLQLKEGDKFTIEHKEQDNIVPAEGQSTISVGSVTKNVADEAGKNVTFKVPTITVDKAGHVTTASENEVSVTLPYFVLTVVGENNVLNNSEYVNVKAVKTANSTELTLSSSVKVGAFPTATTPLVEGLATVQDVEDFVLNNSSIVEGTENEIEVSNSVDTETGVTTYTVKLVEPEIEITEEGTTEEPVDYTAAEAQHTRISDITLDDYGRVIAYTKQTVDENFDLGTY